MLLKIDDSTLKYIENRNTTSLDKFSAYICTDFKIYEEILYHLMANACKFSPENSVIEIEVKLTYWDEFKVDGPNNQDFPSGLGELTTVITDYGKGIP